MTIADQIELDVRMPTDEECAFYHRNGWVKLEGLVPGDVANELRDRLAAIMGVDAKREHDVGWDKAKTPLPKEIAEAFVNLPDLTQKDEFARRVLKGPELGRVAARLLRNRDVRFYFDEAVVKLPVEAGGGKTKWHQDFPYQPMDRQGMTTIWIALTEIPPEMGPMRFMSGSHRSGSLGRVFGTDHDTLSLNPWVEQEYEISPPLHLKPGDATVHDFATIHAAPPNESDQPRWAVITTYFPADALYTGAGHRRTDGLGLKVNAPIEHENFPLFKAGV